MLKTRTWAQIDLKNLEYNYNFLKSKLEDKCQILGIVKANAYGHGCEKIAQKLSQLGVGIFAVACLDEAVKLRENGVLGDILIFGSVPDIDLDIVEKHNISLTINSLEYAKWLSLSGKKIKAHIKIDSGMSRHGFCADDCAGEVEKVLKMENLQICGIYTHLSQADDLSETAKKYTQLQLDTFWSVIDKLKPLDSNIKLHICNSAGTVLGLSQGCDFARPGIALYGLAPSTELTSYCDLKPVMSLKTRVSLVKDIKQGRFVGYGQNFQAKENMKIAILPVGYADGYHRTLSGKAQVFLNGKRADVIGRICMDQTIIDVSNIDCKIGDEVELFGQNIPLDEIAEIVGTISYELVCSVSNRVPRVYID